MSSLAVPAAVITVVGLSEADSVITHSKFIMKPVIGGFILGLFLYAIGELSPYLGTMFAVLVVVSALLTHGQSVFNKIGGKLK